ncbi:glutathionyl-hydroquinone reductase YqjG [Acrasis kona]|uniref:Glutathionyl-hydroquinone reductase YqjG n=1 Tax=Acrasis kona TaxID=1008807 RepID=A0AAW2ZPF0_9EUKA
MSGSKIFDYQKETQTGAFKRTESVFRNSIKDEPNSEFPAESGRYHLYVSHACPWANRTAIVRNLKGLQDHISISTVDWLLEEKGWRFGHKGDADPVHNYEFLREVYLENNPDYEGKVTVPVLYDKKTNRIVNNESSEIIRQLNFEFNKFANNKELDIYPENLRKDIDEVNDWVYNTVNNGVYKSGFATKQEPYEEAFDALFKSLDRLEDILSKNKYLTGDSLTEADVRLFTTLIRFDPVYFGHFKCNKRQLQSYPNLWNYTKHLYQIPEIKETIHFDHIKSHYYASHKKINPTGIVPKGPEINFDEPHDRK